MERAVAAGYVIHLHVVVVPVELTVARVRARVRNGGHDLDEPRVRARHERLWAHVAAAIAIADDAVIYDNTRLDDPFRTLARFRRGHLLPGRADPWPAWAPADLHPDRFDHPSGDD